MKTHFSTPGLLLLSLLSIICTPVFAAPPSDPSCPTTVVRAWFSDRAQVEAFAAHDEPWEVHHDKGWMRLGANANTLQLLLDLGFEIEIDEARTAEICAPRKNLSIRPKASPVTIATGPWRRPFKPRRIW